MPKAETLTRFWLPYVHTQQGTVSTEEPTQMAK